MGDFEVLITVKDRPYLSFVATKRGGIVSSTSIYRYNQLYPGQLDHIPEYIVTNTPPNSHYITLGGNVINSLSDITDIIGNDTVIKIILRVNGRPDVTLCIGANEGRVTETHVKIVTFQKQQELLQQQFRTLDEFLEVLTRVPTLREFSEKAADPEELAELKSNFTLPGGKKTRNKKRKKRKSMKR
jgi:hypothetical protein